MIDGGFIILDELVAAMPDTEEEIAQYLDELGDDQEQPQWVRIAMRMQDNLNEYLENATVLAVNGVNLLGVDHIGVDPISFRKGPDDYAVGLVFFGPPNEYDDSDGSEDEKREERALAIVDAAKYNLRLEVEDGAVSLCTVDKLGRRAF